MDDSDTGLWYTLDHVTDLVASQPVLPAGQPPAPRPWWRTERDPECYQVFLIEAVGDMRRAPPLAWPYRLHWVDTPAQWAARRPRGSHGGGAPALSGFVSCR